MKKLIALLLAFVMVLGLAACGSKAPEAAPEATPEVAPEAAPEAAPVAGEEEYLRLNWEYINGTKSGFKTTLEMGNYLDTFLIWSTLIRMDAETGEVVYDLAKDMQISDDGLTYTFTLADAYWHDGTPVTAADVVFTYNAQVLSPSSHYSANFASIKGYDEAISGAADSVSGIYAKDDKTVVFELTEPNYTFLSMGTSNIFAFGWAAILPAHIFGDTAYADIAAHEYWTNPIGTGPYKIEEVSYPNYCVLTRNENYHRDAAGIEKVLLTSYTDMEAQLAAAMAGDLYSMRAVAKMSAEDVVAQNTDCEYFLHDSAFYRGFEFFHDPAKAAVSDVTKKEVRQAINLIIDKQAIADYLGTASPATTYNNNLEYNSDIPAWERDVEKGKQMLEEAGVDFSKTWKILAYYTDQATIDILDIVCANLAEAGISAEYTMDEKTVNESFQSGEYVMMYYGYGYNVDVYKKFTVGGSDENTFAGFEADHRQQYNDLIAEYANTADADGRKRVCGELQILALDDMYDIPAYFINTGYLINTAKLKGFTGFSQDIESLCDYNFSEWSLG